MKMLVCCNCDHVFSADDAKIIYENVGEFHGQPAYEEWLACPNCRDTDIEDYIEEDEEDEDGIGIGLGISTREYLVSEADIMAEINAIKSKRTESTPVEEKPVNGADMADFKALLDKLDEVIVAINKLGNIEMQNMETLNAIRKNWE